MDRTAEREAGVTILDVGVFLAEIAMLAVLAVAGANLVSGTPARVALAIALPSVAAAGWGRWLAPRAARRLTGTRRLVATLAVFTAAAVLLGVAGAIGWAVGFWVVTATLVVLAGRARD